MPRLSRPPRPGATPAAPIFLHIGPMKTGTTYLQGVLDNNRERLATQGYLFPGETWTEQVRAVQDVLSLTRKDPKVRAQAPGKWQELARQVLHHDGAGSVVSMEFLSFARPRAVRRIVSSLSPADVHVVITVRDATATIPAQWQTSVRSGRTITWPEFMRGVTTVTFRQAQDVERMLRMWGRRVPAQHLHVVTVPPSGSPPVQLWERFATAVGLDPGGFSLPASSANPSLGYVSTELLRRVNVRLGKTSPSDYSATVQQHLAGKVLSPRSATEAPARLDRVTCEFGLEWNRRTRAAVARSGATVSGDLDDLPTTMTATQEARVDDAQQPPTDAELLEAARVAAEGMRPLVARRARRARARGIAVPADGSFGAGASGGDSSRELDAVIEEVAALCRQAIELKQRLDAR